MLVTIVEHYLPGLTAIAAAFLLFRYAPPKRKVESLVLAVAAGLCAVEAEYWIAHGFPWFDLHFFLVAMAITLLALCGGSVGGIVFSILGLAFFTYVNDRFYAPYLLDYILPAICVFLIIVSRKELRWFGNGILARSVPETAWFSAETLIAAYKTSVWHKWGWLTGRPW